MGFELPKVPKPDHVPTELVLPTPFLIGIPTQQDPFSDLADNVHKGPPVFYAEHAYPGLSPAWIVRRHADLQAIYFDTEHFSSKDFAPFAKLIGENWSLVPAEIDPPSHRLYRTMVNPLFTPKAMAKLEGKIRAYAREYILGFKDKGQCEFVSEFAYEFPIKVFMELMGLPQERVQEFLSWEMDLLHNHDMGALIAATKKVVAYLESEVEDRRANPRDDLITWSTQAEVEGRKLTRDEIVGFTFNLFVGGLDTISSNMGLHFLHLARNPADQQMLRENPAMIEAAIDEMMRAYPAVTTFRTVIKPVEVNGVKMLPGDKVAMCTTLAGRDPEAYDNPAEVRFDRKTRHVGFGYGPHLCVGMHLARREMRIAMEEFLALIPPFQLEEGHVVSYHVGVIQPEALPLRWPA